MVLEEEERREGMDFLTRREAAREGRGVESGRRVWEEVRVGVCLCSAKKPSATSDAEQQREH